MTVYVRCWVHSDADGAADPELIHTHADGWNLTAAAWALVRERVKVQLMAGLTRPAPKGLVYVDVELSEAEAQL